MYRNFANATIDWAMSNEHAKTILKSLTLYQAKARVNTELCLYPAAHSNLHETQAIPPILTL